MKKPRRRVNPLTEKADWQCAVLSEFGFSRAYIAANTGLSHNQVSYRNGRYGIKLADYRHGASIGARAVLRVAQKEIEPQLASYLRDRMGPVENKAP